jgi:hypothetical protein
LNLLSGVLHLDQRIDLARLLHLDHVTGAFDDLDPLTPLALALDLYAEGMI